MRFFNVNELQNLNENFLKRLHENLYRDEFENYIGIRINVSFLEWLCEKVSNLFIY